MTKFITKDSGKRVKYDSGFNRDVQEGKPRYDLIPGELLKRLAELYARGAEKYGGEDIWKEVSGMNDISVSNTGYVRITSNQKIIPAWVNKWGYLLVSIPRNKRRHYQVHRLVMEAFVGPSELQVNHINGNKQDNHISNLEYLTAKENNKHARDIGLIVPPQKGKIDFETANLIRSRIDMGEKQKDLAKEFGISPQTVCDINKRRIWDKDLSQIKKRGSIENWKLANTEEEYNRFKASAWRHFMSWDNNWDTEEDHASAVIWNIIAYEWHTKHKQ